MSSENTKPRQFEIFYSGMAGTFSVRNNLDAYLMNVQNLKDDEYIRLVELAPILKLMSEMANYLSEAQAKDRYMYTRQITPYDGILNSYKSFIRDNNLEIK